MVLPRASAGNMRLPRLSDGPRIQATAAPQTSLAEKRFRPIAKRPAQPRIQRYPEDAENRRDLLPCCCFRRYFFEASASANTTSRSVLEKPVLEDKYVPK